MLHGCLLINEDVVCMVRAVSWARACKARLWLPSAKLSHWVGMLSCQARTTWQFNFLCFQSHQKGFCSSAPSSCRAAGTTGLWAELSIVGLDCVQNERTRAPPRIMCMMSFPASFLAKKSFFLLSDTQLYSRWLLQLEVWLARSEKFAVVISRLPWKSPPLNKLWSSHKICSETLCAI